MTKSDHKIIDLTKSANTDFKQKNIGLTDHK